MPQDHYPNVPVSFDEDGAPRFLPPEKGCGTCGAGFGHYSGCAAVIPGVETKQFDCPRCGDPILLTLDEREGVEERAALQEALRSLYEAISGVPFGRLSTALDKAVLDARKALERHP